MSTLWKINCMENKFPGMWQRWFRGQCVAVGWPSQWGYPLDGRIDGDRPQAWGIARNAIKNMAIGDYVVVGLSNNCVGRIGEITGKTIGDDEWDPLVPRSREIPDGEMGRRILVRWELTTGPDNQDFVVQLPKENRFRPGELLQTVTKISSMTVDRLRAIMNDQENWVNLLGKFQ